MLLWNTNGINIFNLSVGEHRSMSSIPNINRVIEETLVFYVICVAPSNYFYN